MEELPDIVIRVLVINVVRVGLGACFVMQEDVFLEDAFGINLNLK